MFWYWYVWNVKAIEKKPGTYFKHKPMFDFFRKNYKGLKGVNTNLYWTQI